MNNFTFCDLKNAAKELKIPKYTTVKTKEDLVKLMRPHAKVQGKKIVSKAEGGRCWSGYTAVKGKKPFEKGSCKKASGGAIYNPTGDPEVSRKNEQIRENMQKARDAKDKNQEKKLLGGRIKYPGESFKQKQPTKDQNRVIYDPMKDREYRKRMLDDQFRDNMILQMDIVDRIYGGTLPQSFRNTVSELKLIKGGSCKEPNACKQLKKEKQGSEQIYGRLSTKAKQAKENYQKCVAEERARNNCPESGYGGNKSGISSGFANLMDDINPITQIRKQNPGLGRKLGGEAQKGVAMTMIAGQPVFLATCGAAGAAAGGPVGALMGTAACKVLFDKLAAKHVSNYADMAGLSTEEIEMAQLLGTFAAKEGVKQSDPDSSRSAQDYMDISQEYLEAQGDIQKEKAEDRIQKEMDKKDAQLQKQLDKQQQKLDKQTEKQKEKLDKTTDRITKPILKPIEQMETYRDKPDNVSSNDWQYLWDNKPAQYTDAEWSEKINSALAKKMSGGKVGKEEIDWDEVDWGSFSKQLERYNSQHKSKLTLPKFAEMILKDPSKYQKKTVRRARFYKNVLEKK